MPEHDRHPIDPGKIEVIVPGSFARTISERIARALAGEQKGSLLSKGMTLQSIAKLIERMAKGGARANMYTGSALLGLDLISAGLPQPETSTLKDVIDQLRVDMAQLELLKNLEPRERNREGDRLKIDVEDLQRSINDAVVSLEEALLERARGLQRLRRPNEGAIPDTSIGRVNVEEFRALADALKSIGETVKDPKLQQQIEGFLKRQEFFLRSGGTPAAPFFDDLGQPRTDERILPRSLGPTSEIGGSSGVDVLFGGAGSDRLAGKAKAATKDLTEMNDAVAQYKDSIRTMVTGIADSNVQLGGQADWLTTLGGLLPGVGQQITDLFATGVAGAEDLDRAVAAMDERLIDALEGAILRGEDLSDTFKGLARDLAKLALNEIKTNGFGGLLGKLGGLFTSAVLPAAGSQSGPHKGAKGLVFTNARLASFAKGGAFDMGARLDKFAHGSAFINTVVNRPTLFPMAKGAGLMGEAGPEAVLPLTRMPNGDLGVSMPDAPAAAVGGPVNITINAPGADRELLGRVLAEVQELRSDLIRVSNSIEPRAVNAINYRRSRGPW